MTFSEVHCRREATSVIDRALHSCDCDVATVSSADYGFEGPCAYEADGTRTDRRATGCHVASYGLQAIPGEIGMDLALHRRR